MHNQTDFDALIGAITAGRPRDVAALLREHPELATAAATRGASRTAAKEFYLEAIDHYLYEGDTPLHIAAAAHDGAIAKLLIKGGADVNVANRRGATPLHYACDGGPAVMRWSAKDQAAMIRLLLDHGANANAFDNSGTAPLHRAIRNRCALAVVALLRGGPDPTLKNKRGSSPLKLAELTTGRGGSGADAAKAEQAAILKALT